MELSPLLRRGRASPQQRLPAAAALCCVTVAVALLGRVALPRVALEAASNPALSDQDSRADLDAFFENPALRDPRASARASDAEARDEWGAFMTSLNSEAKLGSHFCSKHPTRCGKLAADAGRGAAKKDEEVEARNLATARAIQRRARSGARGRDQQKLLSRSQAPDLFKDSGRKASSPATAPLSAPPGARLGDDVMDVASAAAANVDDGDVHVAAGDVGKFMFAKGAHERVLKPADALRRNVAAKLAMASGRLPKLSAADDAELAKCNVPPPRPAYCRLLMDVGMDVGSVQAVLPTRNDTEYRYRKHTGGHTVPLHLLVPARMPHADGADLGMNVLSYGAPDNLVPAEQQHEEGNLVKEDADGPLGGQAEKGGPLSPLIREGATRTGNPHWASEGLHYGTYREKMASLDRQTSDQVVYGALEDYKKLGLALADDYVSPDADSKEREKVAGVHPNFFGERFHPLANFSSVAQWRKAVNSEWAEDDADALEKTAGDVDDDYAGRSAVEQHLLYGNDWFNVGHPVDGAADNGGTVFGDLRVKGPGDGAPMPSFPRDTNAMERHPWTDQAHVFYDVNGPESGGVVGSRPFNTSIETV